MQMLRYQDSFKWQAFRVVVVIGECLIRRDVPPTAEFFLLFGLVVFFTVRVIGGGRCLRSCTVGMKVAEHTLLVAGFGAYCDGLYVLRANSHPENMIRTRVPSGKSRYPEAAFEIRSNLVSTMWL